MLKYLIPHFYNYDLKISDGINNAGITQHKTVARYKLKIVNFRKNIWKLLNYHSRLITFARKSLYLLHGLSIIAFKQSSKE